MTIKHLLHLSFILGKGLGVHTVQTETGPRLRSILARRRMAMGEKRKRGKCVLCIYYLCFLPSPFSFPGLLEHSTPGTLFMFLEAHGCSPMDALGAFVVPQPALRSGYIFWCHEPASHQSHPQVLPPTCHFSCVTGTH